jgi:two-component system, OmpR family, sensor kinase
MKLQTRLILTVSTIVVICSISVGSFSIFTSYKSQIDLISKKINNIQTKVSQNTEDPLSEGLLLANESDIPVAIAFLYGDKLVSIREATGSFKKVPTQMQLEDAQLDIVQVSEPERIVFRAFKMPDNTYLLISSSVSEVKERLRLNLIELSIFVLFALTISLFVVYRFFRRDNEVNNLVESLQINQKKMQEFLGDASHELRTPLTVIKGYFELISKGKFADEKKLDNYLDRVGIEIKRMEQLISDLLLIAELNENPAKSDEQISISQMVSDQIIDLKSLQPSRELKVDIQPEIYIKADQNLINQLLNNIFANIRKHTPEDCLVDILLKQNDGHVQLSIQDAGPGLPEEFYKNGSQYFERFDKSRNRASGGAGLGMSIINRITTNIGAEIKISKGKYGGLATEINFRS